jgi:Flp pilus assembly pilin Flp
MRTLAHLWHDNSGAASAMSVILITTILALGCIVGLTTLRDQIVQELGDVSIALENLNQSYSTASGTFTDTGPFPTDPPNAEPACLDVCGP